MNNELFNKFISPLDIPSQNLVWEDKHIIHEGRSQTISVPKFNPTSRGAKSTQATLWINNLALYEAAATELAIAAIQEQLDKEKQEKEALIRDFEERIAQMGAKTQSKAHLLDRFIAYKAIVLIALATVFNFLMCLINIGHFFGDTFEEMTNKGWSWVFITIMALLIALSTPFFALLKNQKMVNKTIWVLPLDMLVAYLYSHQDLFPQNWLPHFHIISVFAYTAILILIMWCLMKVAVGKGIQNPAEHYERITNSLLS